ncbi:MAG: hypothetical protein FWG85_02540 [Bacteroidetes bacterium]|nr:hypothetical protein [Bacteroidota bacterium]
MKKNIAKYLKTSLKTLKSGCGIVVATLIVAMGLVATVDIYATTEGPYYIYKCPKCSNLLQKGSISSGNNLGATHYSDGKTILPMLPQFPNLTKCKKCNTILWLNFMEEIGTCEWPPWSDKKCKSKWKKADEVKFLDVNDLFRFLELDTVKNDKKNGNLRAKTNFVDF